MKHSLLAVLTMAALTLPARGQAMGSTFDPQISDMLIEMKIPHTWLLSDRLEQVGFSEQALQAAAAGQIEIRARVEFNRWARVLRIYQRAVPPGTPSPLPQSPDANAQNVGSAFDLRIERVLWDDTFGGTDLAVTFVGKTLGRLSPRFLNPPNDEHVILSLRLSKANTNRIENCFFMIPGVISAGGPSATGYLTLERPPI
jgi:hypothetical protein